MHSHYKQSLCNRQVWRKQNCITEKQLSVDTYYFGLDAREESTPYCKAGAKLAWNIANFCPWICFPCHSYFVTPLPFSVLSACFSVSAIFVIPPCESLVGCLLFCVVFPTCLMFLLPIHTTISTCFLLFLYKCCSHLTLAATFISSTILFPVAHSSYKDL